MKIIDKNYDYYDYLQSPDDSIVFDRRNSFDLTKERVIDKIDVVRWNNDSKYRFILMQCGATYWLFLLTITETTETPYQGKRISDYSLELLTTWKNYNKPRKTIDIHFVSFRNAYIFYDNDYYVSNKDYDIDRIRTKANDLKSSIDNNDYVTDKSLSELYIRTLVKNEYKEEIRDIPLLKSCGIAQLIDPVDIFQAIEEHFSLQKTESERTEAVGTTNNDKITMHGFDTKTSFRGGLL